MWSQGTSPALFLLVGFVIGLAVFVGTLLFVWINRSDETIQRAAKVSAVISLSIGLIGAVYWIGVADEPMDSPETIVILTLCVAPTFVVSFYTCLFWLRRTALHSRSE